MITHLQEKARRELLQACSSPGSSERVSQLLLRLIPLKTFVPAIMEELFFSALTGSVQIDNIIPYILRMETAEYNLQMTGQTGASAVAGISGSVGVPALHDPNAPHHPAGVPVVLESSHHQVTLGSIGTAEPLTVNIGGSGNSSLGNSSTGVAHVITTSSGGLGSQRASLISSAGQVLTLYSEVDPSHPPPNSAAATT